MSLSIPFTFIGGPGNKARASEVNANFLAVASKFSEGVGGIGNSDIYTQAGIYGSKLSNVPGNRITPDRMEDDAVDLRVLRDDSTPGAPTAAVNTAFHIRDAIITNAKLVAGTVALDRLKVTTHTRLFNSDILAAQHALIAGSLFSPALPLPNAGIILSWWLNDVPDFIAAAVEIKFTDDGGSFYNAALGNTASVTLNFSASPITVKVVTLSLVNA